MVDLDRVVLCQSAALQITLSDSVRWNPGLATVIVFSRDRIGPTGARTGCWLLQSLDPHGSLSFLRLCERTDLNRTTTRNEKGQL